MANVGAKISFTVELWARVFDLLGWLSLFKWIRCLFPRVKHSDWFVDTWVHFHLLFSVILLLILQSSGLRWWEAIFLVYGGLRVFEVVIYQINVLLFDEYRARKRKEPYAIKGYRRLVILLLANFAEIILWFALFYRNLETSFNTNGSKLNSFFQSLNLSFVTMTNFGVTNISPNEGLASALILTQSVIGLFLALLIIARFIGVLPKPESKDEFEKD